MRIKMKKLCCLFIVLSLISCKTVKEHEPEASVTEAPAETDPPEEESNFRYSGVSSVMIKPGSLRTLSVTANTEEAADSDKYVWFVSDDSVVSIQGNGSKCIVMGRKEGETRIVVTHLDITLPYAFEVYCTTAEQERKFERVDQERTAGWLVSGYSGIEMKE
jgi:hypothetical protein